MLSWTQSPGQAQPGVLGHPSAGCLPAHSTAGRDGTWEMLPTAGMGHGGCCPQQAGMGHGGCWAGPRCCCQPIGIQSMDPAGSRAEWGTRETGNSREGGTLSWGSDVEMLPFLSACSPRPAPRALSWLCSPAEPGCPIPCQWGEASPALLAAEAESLTCHMSCVTIAAALAAQVHVTLAARGLTTCLTPRVGSHLPALMPWDRTPPSPGSIWIPLQCWGFVHSWRCFSDYFQAGRFAAVPQILCLLEPFLGILDRANTPGC